MFGVRGLEQGPASIQARSQLGLTLGLVVQRQDYCPKKAWRYMIAHLPKATWGSYTRTQSRDLGMWETKWNLGYKVKIWLTKNEAELWLPR